MLWRRRRNRRLLWEGLFAFNEHGVPVAVPAGQQNDRFCDAPEMQDLLLLDVPQSYEHRLEYVKRLVDDDSKVVASSY